MYWGLSEDLIDKNNYDEVNKLLDFIFNDIETNINFKIKRC